MLLVFFPEDRTYMKVLTAADLPERKPFVILKKLPDCPPSFVQHKQVNPPEEWVWALFKTNIPNEQTRTEKHWWCFKNEEEFNRHCAAVNWNKADFEIRRGNEFMEEWLEPPMTF